MSTESGKYRNMQTGEIVTAVRWSRDGDHPKVERYPIEGRDYKGLLTAGPKDKFALRFGEWILEDAGGRLWVESSQSLPAKYQSLAGGGGTLAGLAVFLALALLAWFAGGHTSNIEVIWAVTHLMYYSSIKGQWDGTTNAVFDLDTDTIKVSAHTNTYTVNQDTHDFFDDVTNEVTGTNYTAGGATLASPTVTRSTGTVTFDGADIVWTQSGAGFSTARKFVIYKSTGTATTSRLFSVVTADADVGNVTGDLTIAWSASGIATWTTT